MSRWHVVILLLVLTLAIECASNGAEAFYFDASKQYQAAKHLQQQFPQHFFKRNADGDVYKEHFNACNNDKLSCPKRFMLLGYQQHVMLNANKPVNNNTASVTNAKSSLINIEPATVLNFEERPLFVPYAKTIVLRNDNDNLNLTLTEIFVDSNNFLVKVFNNFEQQQSSVLLPKTNTTVSILFNPTVIGPIKATLFVSFTVGSSDSANLNAAQQPLFRITYELKGSGAANKFEIEGAASRRQVLAGASAEEIISLYNPRSSALQIKEAFLGVPQLAQRTILSIATNISLQLLCNYKTIDAQNGGIDDEEHESSSTARTSSAIKTTSLVNSPCEIPAQQRKHSLSVQFTSKKLGNFFTYLYLLLDYEQSSDSEVFFMIPIEFIVIPFQPEEVDFGTLTSSTDLHVHFKNDGPQSVLVQGISATSDFPSIRFTDLESKGALLMSNSSLTFLASVALRNVIDAAEQENGEYRGQLLVKTVETESSSNEAEPSSSIVSVPFKVRIFHGKLSFSNVTSFFVSPESYKTPAERVLEITNDFQVPIQFQSALIHDTNFKIKEFQVNLVLQPQQSSRILTLELKLNQSLCSRYKDSNDVLLQTVLEIQTNITKVLVPVHIFHGKVVYVPLSTRDMKANPAETMTCGSPELHALVAETERQEDVEHMNRIIQLGIVPMPKGHLRHKFALYNPNPVPIALRTFEISRQPQNMKEVIAMQLERVCTRKGEYIPNEKQQLDQGSLVLQPGDKALVNLDAISNNVKEKYEGRLRFETNFSRELSVPVNYWQLQGDAMFSFANEALTADFGEAFPGKTLRRPIYVTNTYEKGMKITFNTTSDTRFSVIITRKVPASVTNFEIGYVEFDASKKEDYLDIIEKQRRSKKGATLIKTSDSASNNKKHRKKRDFMSEVSKTELEDLKFQQDAFKRMKDHNVSATITLATNSFLVNFVLNAKAKLIQPTIVNTRELAFNVTEVGKQSKRYVTITNPSDFPIDIKLFVKNTLHHYHNSNQQANLHGAADSTQKHDQATQAHQQYEFYLDPEGTHAGEVAPHKEGKFGPIVFAPSSSTEQIAGKEPILYVRNNLTVLEAIKLKGIGGMGKLAFLNSKKSLNMKSLHFAIKESHIGYWKSVHNKPQFVLKRNIGSRGIEFKRKFTLVNIGNLPIEISYSSINSYGCTAFNVKLHNCGPIMLQPQQRYTYIVSYNPDFSISSMNLEIMFHTSLGTVETFPILFTIPREIMPDMFHILQGRDQSLSQPLLWTLFGYSQHANYLRVAATLLVFIIAAYIITLFLREEMKIYELPVSVQSSNNLKGVTQPQQQQQVMPKETSKTAASVSTEPLQPSNDQATSNEKRSSAQDHYASEPSDAIRAHVSAEEATQPNQQQQVAAESYSNLSSIADQSSATSSAASSAPSTPRQQHQSQQSNSDDARHDSPANNTVENSPTTTTKSESSKKKSSNKKKSSQKNKQLAPQQFSIAEPEFNDDDEANGSSNNANSAASTPVSAMNTPSTPMDDSLFSSDDSKKSQPLPAAAAAAAQKNQKPKSTSNNASSSKTSSSAKKNASSSSKLNNGSNNKKKSSKVSATSGMNGSSNNSGGSEIIISGINSSLHLEEQPAKPMIHKDLLQTYKIPASPKHLPTVMMVAQPRGDSPSTSSSAGGNSISPLLIPQVRPLLVAPSPQFNARNMTYSPSMVPLPSDAELKPLNEDDDHMITVGGTTPGMADHEPSTPKPYSPIPTFESPKPILDVLSRNRRLSGGPSAASPLSPQVAQVNAGGVNPPAYRPGSNSNSPTSTAATKHQQQMNNSHLLHHHHQQGNTAKTLGHISAIQQLHLQQAAANVNDNSHSFFSSQPVSSPPANVSYNLIHNLLQVPRTREGNFTLFNRLHNHGYDDDDMLMQQQQQQQQQYFQMMQQQQQTGNANGSNNNGTPAAANQAAFLQQQQQAIAAQQLHLQQQSQVPQPVFIPQPAFNQQRFRGGSFFTNSPSRFALSKPEPQTHIPHLSIADDLISQNSAAKATTLDDDPTNDITHNAFDFENE